MRALVVNAGRTRKSFEDFCDIISTSTAAAGLDIELTARTSDTLDDMIYDPNLGYIDKACVPSFDKIDFVFVIGDGTQMPWSPSMRKLFVLVKMCFVCDKCLFGTAIVAHMIGYICSTGAEWIRVLNGRGRGGPLADIGQHPPGGDVSVLEERDRFLDQHTGDLYKFDRNLHSWMPYAKTGIKWPKAGNNDGVDMPIRYAPKDPVHILSPRLQTARRTEMQCHIVNHFLQHPLFKGVGRQHFVVTSTSRRYLDESARKTCVQQFNVLVQGTYGPMVIEYANQVGVQFDVCKDFPVSGKILLNYILYKYKEMQGAKTGYLESRNAKSFLKNTVVSTLPYAETGGIKVAGGDAAGDGGSQYDENGRRVGKGGRGQYDPGASTASASSAASASVRGAIAIPSRPGAETQRGMGSGSGAGAATARFEARPTRGAVTYRGVEINPADGGDGFGGGASSSRGGAADDFRDDPQPTQQRRARGSSATLSPRLRTPAADHVDVPLVSVPTSMRSYRGARRPAARSPSSGRPGSTAGRPGSGSAGMSTWAGGGQVPPLNLEAGGAADPCSRTAEGQWLATPTDDARQSFQPWTDHRIERGVAMATPGGQYPGQQATRPATWRGTETEWEVWKGGERVRKGGCHRAGRSAMKKTLKTLQRKERVIKKGGPTSKGALVQTQEMGFIHSGKAGAASRRYVRVKVSQQPYCSWKAHQAKQPLVPKKPGKVPTCWR